MLTDINRICILNNYAFEKKLMTLVCVKINRFLLIA